MGKTPKNVLKQPKGKILLGVLSKNYSTDEAAIEDMKKYQAEIENALSVESTVPVIRIRARWSLEFLLCCSRNMSIKNIHGSCNISRALLGQEETIVNALDFSDRGKVGFVNIATGPLSSQEEPTEVPLETAIALLKDMGASSIKYFL